MILTVSVMLLT